MPFDELRPGAYLAQDPGYSSEPIGPRQRFKGDVPDENITIVTPISTFSDKFYPQKFLKGQPPQVVQRFVKQKKGLGEYDTVDPLRMLAPSAEGLPPQKRDRTTEEKIQDAMVGLLHGAGIGTADIVGLPRAAGEQVNTALGDVIPPGLLGMLPSSKDVKRFAVQNQRYMPIPPELLAQINQGPQTPGGEYASSLGEYAPTSAMGAAAGLRRLVPYLFGLQSVMP